MINFDDLYSQSIKISNSLIEDIRFNRGINMQPVQSCSELICHYLSNSTDIVHLLISVQDKNKQSA